MTLVDNLTAARRGRSIARRMANVRLDQLVAAQARCEALEATVKQDDELREVACSALVNLRQLEALLPDDDPDLRVRLAHMLVESTADRLATVLECLEEQPATPSGASVT